MARLLAWYRVSSSVGAVIALLVANVLPLAGVLFFGWSVWTILIVYWLENGIVGVFNVLKMVRAEGPAASGPPTWKINGRATAEKVTLIPFFIVHYGIFWVVHGVFVFTLPIFADAAGGPAGGAAVIGDAGPDPWTIGLAVLVLFISHGASFLFDFLGAGEFRRVTASGQMFAPYGRLVVLHMTIIFGALAVSFVGAPIAAIVILVALKTVLDLGLHLAEHRKAQPAL